MKKTIKALFWAIVIMLLTGIIRKVPANTILVIDRNSHYLKTKRKGLYLFNPLTDEITSKVSTQIVHKQYTNIFENHESTFKNVTFWVEYKAEDCEQVISSLSDSRRSIDDIVNCAMEVLYTSFDNREASDYVANINTKFFKQLESMLEPFYIDVVKTGILAAVNVPAELGAAQKFQRHVSGGGSSGDPIR